jgi:hypothetical protein
MFATADVTVEGQPSEYRLIADSGNTVTRRFCGACGSPLWGANSAMPGFMTISAGVFDEPGTLTPQVAIFARTRQHWDVMDGAVRSFAVQPDWTPDKGA